MDKQKQLQEQEKIHYKHHQRQKLCETRPQYRQGKKLTAVKCYTVASESQHLFVYGVPQINLCSELKRLFSKFGKLKTIELVVNCETEIFTECYHLQFEEIAMARKAKRVLDNRNFYGGILHVCYAPERESVEETRNKLLLRNKQVVNYRF